MKLIFLSSLFPLLGLVPTSVANAAEPVSVVSPAKKVVSQLPAPPKQVEFEAVQISLNGKGRAELVLKDGDFEIKPGVAYRVKTDTSQEVSADENGILSFPVQLDGKLSATIQPTK